MADLFKSHTFCTITLPRTVTVECEEIEVEADSLVDLQNMYGMECMHLHWQQISETISKCTSVVLVVWSLGTMILHILQFEFFNTKIFS